jgi:hypothetical protein
MTNYAISPYVEWDKNYTTGLLITADKEIYGLDIHIICGMTAKQLLFKC